MQGPPCARKGAGGYHVPTSFGTFGSNLLDTCHLDGFTLAGDEHLVLAPAAAASRVTCPTWNLACMGTACPHSQGTLGDVLYKIPQFLSAPPLRFPSAPTA